jgi:4-carboxymuconolactone decarboxylase
MSASPPRVPPLDPSEFTPEQAGLVGDWTHLVFSRVLARHPGMYRSFVPFIEQLIARTTLPPRDREVLVLRTLGLSDETYELHHHTMIAVNAGMDPGEIAALAKGEALELFDTVLIKVAEQLCAGQDLSDATWAALREHYTEAQAMEVVFLVGCYLTMAMLTKTFRMPLEGDEGDFEQITALRQYT